MSIDSCKTCAAFVDTDLDLDFYDEVNLCGQCRAEPHNGHVLKWVRWQHFWAARQHRFFAQAVWATQYELEMKG